MQPLLPHDGTKPLFCTLTKSRSAGPLVPFGLKTSVTGEHPGFDPDVANLTMLVPAPVSGKAWATIGIWYRVGSAPVLPQT